MSRPLLCIGTYAKTPYHIEKAGKNVYCIEELCYCLVHNAFLLDEDSFGNDLYDWIEKECSLEKLADELRSMAMKKCSIASLAGTIMDYVGYNSRKEIDRTEEILRANAGMDIYRKKMARAEFLMDNRQYGMAFREYEFLLENTPDLDRDLKARIEHNEGVMYARLFLFDKAARMFRRAFEDGRDQESFLQYLMAVRMTLSDKEYVSYIADNESAYEASLEIEKRIKEVEEFYGSSVDNHMVKTLSVYKSEGKMHEYYNMIGNMTDNLKSEYRGLIREKTI